MQIAGVEAGRRPDVPREWATAQLATFRYRDSIGHRSFNDPAFETPRSAGATSFVSGGDDFDAAVAKAQRLATRHAFNQAHAVLQASDGAYWIAGLGGGQRFAYHAVDGWQFTRPAADGRWSLAKVEPVHPDLRAVVGIERVFDFRQG